MNIEDLSSKITKNHNELLNQIITIHNDLIREMEMPKDQIRRLKFDIDSFCRKIESKVNLYRNLSIVYSVYMVALLLVVLFK